MSCPNEIPFYTVRFDSQGGSAVSAKDALKGTKIADPSLPSKAGYEFGGWYKESACIHEWVFTKDVVISNITLYAKWTANTYSVVYDTNGAEAGTEPSTQEKIHNVVLNLSTNTGNLVRTGYIFSGWNTQADDLGINYLQGSTYTSNESIILYAKWNIAYSITYYLDGGINNPANPTSYHVESDEIIVAVPSKDGYQFDGWYNDAALTLIAPTFITTGSTGNKSYYAKWLELFPIYYHLDSGSNSIENPSAYTSISLDIVLKNPSREGYIFDGWYTDNSYSQPLEIIKSRSSGPVDVYAKWNKIFTISYFLDGGTNHDSNPSTYIIKSADIILGNPSRVGYSFEGWYEDSGYVVSSSTIARGSTGDKSFYAKWVAQSNTPYLIEYYQQNLTGTGYALAETKTLGGTTDTIVVAPTHEYVGFNENQIHENAVPSGRLFGDGSLVLKRYYDRNTYTVKLTENGGSLVADYSGIKYGATINVPETTIREGYSLVGWYKENTFKSLWQFSSDSIAGEITLFARWEANTDTPYMVEHFLQDKSGSEYTLLDSAAEHRVGITGSTVSAEPVSFLGFHIKLAHEGTAPSGEVAGDGSLALRFYYDRDTFSVSFSVYGGSSVSAISDMRYDASILEPVSPLRAGYDFAGWYRESAYVSSWDFSKDTVTTDTTLHAKWNVKTNILVFEANGGQGSMSPMGINSNTQITLVANNFYWPGYTFIGWSEIKNGDVIFYNQDTYTMGVENDVLYAKWSANPDTIYKVEHYKQNPTRNGYVLDSTENLTGTTDTFVTALPKIYTGLHENVTHASRLNGGTIAGDGSLTLKLFYDWDAFTVEFSENGGITLNDATNVRYGTTIEQPISPVRYGNTLAWYTDLEFHNKWNFLDDIVTQDLILYSNWIANTDTPYRVEHYKENVDYSYSLAETKNLTGTTDTIAVAAAKSYLGFHEDVSHLSRMSSGNIAGFGSLVLRLYYQRDVYNVSFSTNGGSTVSSIEGRYGSFVTKPSPVPEKYGFTFGGWFKDSALSDNWDLLSDTVANNMTLYSRWIKQTLLTPSRANLDYGSSLAIHGDTILVGGDNTGIYGDAGPVTAFTKNVVGWEETGTIQSNDFDTKDGFGRVVDLGNSYSIIGAPFDNEYTTNSGSAYVFKKDGTSEWVQFAKLFAYDASDNMQFGTSVAIFGEYIVIGTLTNSVYIYKINEHSDGCDLKDVIRSTSNGFGKIVGMDGDFLVIGAPKDKKIFIYKRNAVTETWSITDTLVVDGLNSLAMDDSYVIFGDPSAKTGRQNFGSASLFTIDQLTGKAGSIVKLNNSFSADHDGFGQSVGISSGKAVVGAHSVAKGSIHNAGSSYLYSLDEETGTWRFECEIQASDLVGGARFGWSIDIDGNSLIVGASNAFGKGRNYIFEL